MFAETLRLKGSVPPIVLGKIKQRKKKAVPDAWKLQGVEDGSRVRLLAGDDRNYVDYMFDDVSDEFYRELRQRELDEVIEAARADDIGLDDYDYYDDGYDRYLDEEFWLIDVEDAIVPRLRAKLDDRPTSDVEHKGSSRRYRTRKSRQREQSKIAVARPDKYRSA